MTDSVLTERLSKRYRLGLITSSTLREDVQRLWNRALGRPDPFQSITDRFAAGVSSERYVWALRDLDLAFEEGRATGIIGRNGAGKSTLLKILSRITAPTAGRVLLRGRVASLLEVGTGFHPELTGRENIFLNGAILGMTKPEVRRKLDRIIDFSGVSDFVDTPVKRYSSGMRVRLAFAVAAHLEPEILVVDEVLSVGDAAFQARCLAKMEDVTRAGRTVLFVSHQMAMVTSLCQRAILLEDGRVAADGPPDQVVSRYLSEARSASDPGAVAISDLPRDSGSGALRFIEWSILDDERGHGTAARCYRGCEFHLRFAAAQDRDLSAVSVALTLRTPLGQALTTSWTRLTNSDFPRLPADGVIVCRLEELPLVPGDYRLGIWCSVNDEVADQIFNAGSFDVLPTDVFGTGRLPSRSHHGDLIIKNQTWRYQKESNAPKP